MNGSRRTFLTKATFGISAVAVTPVLGMNQIQIDLKSEPPEEIGATEDLMREHGVLNRILLIYEEGLRRLREKEDVSPEVFNKPAQLVRKFVEDYHEKLEENFIFPEFEKQKKLIDLVAVLREQHQAGRRVTDVILHKRCQISFVDRRLVSKSLRPAGDLSACIDPMRPVRILCSFPLFIKLCQQSKSKILESSLRRKKTACSVTRGLKRQWNKWLSSRSNWASTN